MILLYYKKIAILDKENKDNINKLNNFSNNKELLKKVIDINNKLATTDNDNEKKI